MSDTSLAPAGPPRHGFVHGALGGVLTLVALTVAHAALPDPVQRDPRAARPAHAEAAARARRVPVLIAFSAPLPDGEVGSPFGLRQLPWEAHARLHAGVDIEVPEPEPVLAAADGVVTRTGEDAGYGRFVELTHAEGITTLYGHLQRLDPAIRPGAAVKAGTAVGRVGSTGTSTGVHLHFEVRDPEGRPLNPALFIGRAFATAEELPLREARRIPRLVRVAFVSHIPRSKQAEMAERAEHAQVLQELAQLKVRGRVHAVLQPAPSSQPPPAAIAPMPAAPAPAASPPAAAPSEPAGG